MSKKTKKETIDFGPICLGLDKISYQLERLILCQEKRLSGQMIPEYDSKEDLKTKTKEAQNVTRSNTKKRKS